MSILKWLGLTDESPSSKRGDGDAVHAILRELDALPEGEARYLAGFAYVLGRVANADRSISEDETAFMEHAAAELGSLSPAQAALVVAVATNQHRLFGGTENFVVTRELAEKASREQREHLLHCLFAVAAVDDSISSVEESQLRQIASELGFSHAEFVQVRSVYNGKREVVKMLRQR